jgi:hypothetical protein
LRGLDEILYFQEPFEAYICTWLYISISDINTTFVNFRAQKKSNNVSSFLYVSQEENVAAVNENFYSLIVM